MNSKSVKFDEKPISINIENCDKTGYDAVAEIIDDWYNRMDYGTWLPFVLSIQLDDNDIETTYVERQEDGSYEWEFDWWEGQRNFKLLGFCPLLETYLTIEGFPPIEE